MNRYKKLLGNIFFKVAIVFLLVSFVFLGVSSFLFGDISNWVAKVGGEKISYNKFQRALEIDRESIIAANKNSKEAENYVNSERFRVEVLNRLVSQKIMEKLRDQFKVDGDRKIILKAIAKDKNFYKDGKFNHELFNYFLAQNGLDEKRYLRAIQDEVMSGMIINSISSAIIVDEELARKVAEVNEERRVVDIAYVNIQSIKTTKPTNQELKAFYEENKSNFTESEKRKVLYFTIPLKNIVKQVEVLDQEISSYYEKNKSDYQLPETRDFMHVLFKKKDLAEKFLKELNLSNLKSIDLKFSEISKSNDIKNQNNIYLKNIKKSDLLSDVSDQAFSAEINSASPIIESDLGFHIFFVKKISKNNFIEIAKVKNDIKQIILKSKSDKEIQAEIARIDAKLISKNSLDDIAKDKNLTVKSIYIDNRSIDYSVSKNSEINSLEDFTKNAFLANENQASKLYFSANNNQFYALIVKKIDPKKLKEFEDVRIEVENLYNEDKKNKELKIMANKIADEMKSSPQDFYKIVTKYNLKLEKEKILPRYFVTEIKGRRMPYADQFLEEVFVVNIGKVTAAFKDNSSYKIALLKQINHQQISQDKINLYKKEFANLYRNEILEELNKFMQTKYPIKINEKFLKSLKQE